MADKGKNTAIRYGGRPSSVDVRALSTYTFPYDAFEFDDPNVVSEPKVRLKDPWGFEVGTITVSEITGGVAIEGQKVIELTDFPVVELASREGFDKIFYNRLGVGIYSQDREFTSTPTKVSDKDLRQLFLTGDNKVGGISVGELPGVYIGNTRYITDAVVDIGFVDWANIYCIKNTDHKIYKYNILTGTNELVIDAVAQWVDAGCSGVIFYQLSDGVYQYDGVTSEKLFDGVYFSGQANNNILILRGLDGKIYTYDGEFTDTGYTAYGAIYCDGLYLIDPTDLTLSLILDNALLDGIVLQGDSYSGSFIANSFENSYTLTADADQLKKVFVHDIISGGGFSNAEILYKGGNYVRLSVQATSDLTNYPFTLFGTRITLNANQVLIPGTVTANEIQVGAVGADQLADASVSTSKVDQGNLSIYSSDYIPDTSGWAIDKDGDVEFNSGTFRGTLVIGTTGTNVADVEIIADQAAIDAAQAITDAATAQGTADGKVTTFYQTTPPTAEGVGDLWVDTDDSNKLYRWSGSAWTNVQDGGISQAIADAANAQSTADGKIVTFYQASAPSASAIGDLWVETDNNNKPWRWSGSAWQSIQDGTIAVAQATADGKNTIYYQTTQPTGVNSGDIWFDTDGGNLQRIFNGTTWEVKISIQSSNYSAGSLGWYINEAGDAEFNDVTVRGTIYSKDALFEGDVQMPSLTLWKSDITDVLIDLDVDSVTTIKSKIDALVDTVYGRQYYEANDPTDRYYPCVITSYDNTNPILESNNSKIFGLLERYTDGSANVHYMISIPYMVDGSFSTTYFSRTLVTNSTKFTSLIYSNKIQISYREAPVTISPDLYVHGAILSRGGFYMRKRGLLGSPTTPLVTQDDVFKLLESVKGNGFDFSDNYLALTGFIDDGPSRYHALFIRTSANTYTIQYASALSIVCTEGNTGGVAVDYIWI